MLMPNISSSNTRIESKEMLKKVMAMLASKYLAIKVRIRAIETQLMIQSLLLRDKKMIRHLFRQRKHFNLSNKVKDEDEDMDDDCESENPSALTNDCVVTTPLIHRSTVTTPNSMVAEEGEDRVDMTEDDGGDTDLRHSTFEDERKGGEPVSVIEMVKNAKEGRGKKFVLEDDIDKVADLFIQRFHNQIRLQKLLCEDEIEGKSC